MISYQANAANAVRWARATTGSIGGTSNADVALTWNKPFPDTNYTVMTDVELDEGGDSLRALRVRSKTTTGCVVNVQNSAITSKTGTVHAIATPD